MVTQSSESPDPFHCAVYHLLRVACHLHMYRFTYLLVTNTIFQTKQMTSYNVHNLGGDVEPLQ